MGMDINETGNVGTRDETRGNSDEWRGVRDAAEIGWTWGWKRYSRGRAEQTCWRSISDQYLTPWNSNQGQFNNLNCNNFTPKAVIIFFNIYDLK